jgi:hypothetical protein
MEKCIAIQVTRFAEFHDFGNRGETTLDLKHQKLETERGEITRAAPTFKEISTILGDDIPK